MNKIYNILILIIILVLGGFLGFTKFQNPQEYEGIKKAVSDKTEEVKDKANEKGNHKIEEIKNIQKKQSKV